MKIREAVAGDEEEMGLLLTDMGYPATALQLKDRLEPIMNNSSYLTLVTEENGSLVSMLGMHFERSYVSDIVVARIITMVTASDYRQRGIGRNMLNEAEKRAVEAGATLVVLNSGNRDERKAAHKFYEGCGFEAKSTGFYKEIKE
ncbi:GNAT family N-acetyltransferase [Guptibacillus hwajinpoensis]|uniref:GNAT superfamily N-acetyltransferase n=1 Tax=Guptibacillus hwajinpoensis TaxID=208199 RepID=A0ABU0K0Y3_9BACL|nr:GNAT family N-acetyltransferase [Alkalihalobacillus hemicentroti]MDQ0481812.1 GNAT superfamily N-acetyltransferase [Alkalihalobacillus hemicentroti]